ncbi:50S ribosomal protein L21 [Candidatus Mycoplasma haematolamae str. Purdue]|uniref:50S ribosomal protein L21 n=1 Tax=Mycoplasma haematolamae (strain Purdue) TaxID=1212765 RepID=I7CIT9_MYCHA|nr:50S ribosomal protein L21 [Candidatus Mycoplasma haematolamae]AFO51789.1 50S ribosomal protein L21 [Candidatus Mycoplasma haematolamae str. Purdue]
MSKKEASTPNLCFEIKNKQYLCKVGDQLISDFFSDSKEGDELAFQNVLLWEDKVGNPYIPKLEVKCKVVKHIKNKKLHIIHIISQKRHRKRMGFRAKHTLLEVSEVKKLS